jgi:hypothetical protein
MAKLYNLIIIKQFSVRNITQLFIKFFNSEFVYIVENNNNNIPQLKHKPIFFKEVFHNKNLIENKKLILKQLLNVSNSLYDSKILNFKWNQIYNNLIQYSVVKNLELKIINIEESALECKYIKAFPNLKYVSSINLLNYIANRNNYYNNSSNSKKKEYIVSKLAKIYINNEPYEISHQQKHFNVQLFYQTLLDMNMNLYYST